MEKLICKIDGEILHEAATEAQLICEVALPCFGGPGPNSFMRFQLFKSAGTGSKGGYMVRVNLGADSGGFEPHVVEVKRGFEIHAAGECESKILLEGLRRLLDVAS
ncbi:hypothetical protein [Methylomonas koyamae]|uniref:hypothetical protein n=1 Tax=Methylomonas koyamae TaxID=702114 RepID=UPI002873E8DB|nr:hypothetical protein [Methylomonas koyamae]WNB76008.1 hypothetical protein RI210_00170 [Methylomonas koyamae]